MWKDADVLGLGTQQGPDSLEAERPNGEEARTRDSIPRARISQMQGNRG